MRHQGSGIREPRSEFIPHPVPLTLLRRSLSVRAVMVRRFHGLLAAAVLSWTAAATAAAPGDSSWDDLGPLWSRFRLTLDVGEREEGFFPFWYSQESEGVSTFGVPPFFTRMTEPAIERDSLHVLYPLFTRIHSGTEWRWQVGQLLGFAGGAKQDGDVSERRTLFPFYFRQRTTSGTNEYLAVLPFYGHTTGRLLRDEVEWAAWPLWIRSRKKDVVTDNYAYPLVHVRHGNALEGWQFWPLVGHETKGLTWRTNFLDEAEPVGGHEKWFAAWPIFFDTRSGLGTTNEAHAQSLLPLYSFQRSPQRDSTSYGWPLGVTVTDDREKKYREVGVPWPLVVFARGEGKHMDRVWPFYSHGTNESQHSEFYAWPLWMRKGFRAETLERERSRVLLFLYSDTVEKHEGAVMRRRTDLWPLFTSSQRADGSTRLQVFAPVEPFIPANNGIPRNWSPLWSLWRSEHNAVTGASSGSFLWNLYRREAAPGSRKASFLFGLFQYQSGKEGRHVRLFHIPLGKAKPNANGNE